MGSNWAWSFVGLVGSLLVLGACPSGEDDGTGVTTNSGPSSLSNEDGPEPLTCEQAGGVCSCFGSCDPGMEPMPSATCPQPPDESGACGQECCVPMASTTMATTAGTASTAGTADGTADTMAPTCDCATLPVCATAPDEDCNGQYPDGHCCDEQGEPMTCSCLDPCDGGINCCTLQPFCA